MASSTKTWVNNAAPSVEDTDLNGFKNENNNLIVGSGQSLNTGDPQQTHKAIAHYATVGQFFTGGGIADVYTLAAVAPRVAPPALTDGMEFRGIFPADNTGAATVNPFTLGAIDIKLAGGTTDPAAGQIKSGREATLIYRTSPGAHAELILPGSVTTTVIAASGTYNSPPGVKSLKFTAVGGGGGGGGGDGQGGGTAMTSGGGAGGGSAIKHSSIIESSYTVTIGAGGAGGADTGGNGGAGGATTVVSTNVNLTANGGAGGGGDVGGAGGATSGSAVGGTATGGDLNLSGSDSSSGRRGGGAMIAASHPGDAVFGGRGKTAHAAVGGIGVRPGAGGGATFSQDVATNAAGGAGADGIIVVEEFF